MATRDYYVILGVQAADGQGNIRAAYRDLARRYHPDRAGPEGAAAFREITNAFSVLGDAERRRRYDEELARMDRSAQISDGDPLPLTRPRWSMRRDVVDTRPSYEALLDRFERNFTGLGVPKAERAQELHVDVAIRCADAARGTTLRLGLPSMIRCPKCRGVGCLNCRGRGLVETERPLDVAIPPLSGRGTTLVVPLSHLGVRNLYLNVRVRVDEGEPPGS